MPSESTTRQEQLRTDLESLRLDRDAPAPAAATRRKGGRAKYVIAAIAVLAIAAAWQFLGAETPVEVAKATVASTAEIGPEAVLSGSGYVVTGDRYVSIGVRVPGRIDRYFVEEGQSVEQNDALVQLDDRDYQAAVRSTEAALEVARANLALAEAELARGLKLRSGAIVSQQDLDVLVNKSQVARATIQQLEAQLAQARVNLEYTTLRAPTSGVILAKLKEVGEIAVPGGFAGSGDLVRLANLSDMRAEVDVNEADLNRVHMGQVAEVVPDAYPDRPYKAGVVKLYPQVDRQKGTLKVEVKILDADEKLLPDMSARVTFFADPSPQAATSATTVVVPETALHKDDRGDPVVWVVNDGRARRTRVETAGAAGKQVRIASGLKGGETVVVGEPPARDGAAVRVTERTTQ
jgi:RND family efflux transporter MFP subunit